MVKVAQQAAIDAMHEEIQKLRRENGNLHEDNTLLRDVLAGIMEEFEYVGTENHHDCWHTKSFGGGVVRVSMPLSLELNRAEHVLDRVGNR